MNLRRRVTYALASIAVLFVAGVTALAYISIEDQEDDLVDELVMQQARQLAERAQRGELQGSAGAAYLQPGPYWSAWLSDAHGRAVPSAVPDHLRRLSDGPHRLEEPGLYLHAVVLQTAAGRLYVQYDAAQNEAKVHEFGQYLLGLGSICALLAVAIAWRAAGWVVSPIERLTQRLTQWAPHAVAGSRQTINHAATDEENQLLQAFGGVQARFEQSLAREREFIDNVSHEIRTPLAALRTDLELMQQHAAADSPERQRVQRGLSAIDEIAGAIMAARMAARTAARALVQQRPAATAVAAAHPINLRSCIDDAWISATANEQTSVTLRNEVGADTVLPADRHALLTILRNLFRNTLEHAAAAQCRAQFTARGLEVSDDGPGIDPADLPFVFERYYRGRMKDAPSAPAGDQRGLGLAIARQLAELHGWSLSVEPAQPERGTRFVLALPSS